MTFSRRFSRSCDGSSSTLSRGFWGLRGFCFEPSFHRRTLSATETRWPPTSTPSRISLVISSKAPLNSKNQPTRPEIPLDRHAASAAQPIGQRRNRRRVDEVADALMRMRFSIAQRKIVNLHIPNRRRKPVLHDFAKIIRDPRIVCNVIIFRSDIHPLPDIRRITSFTLTTRPLQMTSNRGIAERTPQGH